MLKDIVARIDDRLRMLGLSATHASVEAGLSKDGIRNLRRAVAAGKSAGVSTKTLEKLAPVLQATTQWLAHGVKASKLDDPLDIELLELFTQLSAEQKKSILQLVSSIGEKSDPNQK